MNNKINYEFVALPKQCLNLGANELKLFAILFNLSGKYANEEGYFFHSQKKLCNMMDYSERYTRTITHNLEQMGIITVRRHNDGGRNASYGQAHEYKINMDAVLSLSEKGGTIVPPSNKENVAKGGTIVPPSKEKNDPEKAEQNDKKGGTIVPKKAEQNDLPIENEENIELKEIEKENRKEKENESVTATVKTATDEFTDMLEVYDRQDEEKQKGKTPSVKVEVKEVNEERMNDKTTDGEPTTEGITSTERMEEEQNQTSTPRVEGIGTGGQHENTISQNEGIISSTGTTGQDTPNESKVLLTATRTETTTEPTLTETEIRGFNDYTKAMKKADTAERAEQCVTALRRYSQVLIDKCSGDIQPIIAEYAQRLEQAKNDNPIMREYIDAM